MAVYFLFRGRQPERKLTIPGVTRSCLAAENGAMTGQW